ncbi:MAG: CoA-transferase [Acidimicrobiia bacterium]
MSWTTTELMVIAAARRLTGVSTCFVGIGIPNLACSLARRLGAEDLELIYESGVVGAEPERLPLSIGDPGLVSGARIVASMYELFSFYLQGGLIDVAFLGAAQIDRRGSLNTTVIGSYNHPSVRLPGSGGACEIALNARRVFVLARQSPATFVGKLDFVTSPGHVPEAVRKGRGPELVMTQLGAYDFRQGEMTLVSLHPGVSIEEVRASTGWEVAVSDQVDETAPPTEDELAALRALDPRGVYLR